MTTFLSALDAHLKVTEEAHAETSRRLIELAGAIVGVQSATRLTVDDAKQSQRQTHRTLENMLWQLAGPGKAANQSVKDVLISSAKWFSRWNSTCRRMPASPKAPLRIWKTWRTIFRQSATI